MAAAIPTIIGALATTATVATQVQNVKEKKKQGREAKKSADARIALLNAQNVAQESERRKRLKTALATQKSLFGARGISTSSGTALAIANQAIVDNRTAGNLNKKKNALQLNQIRRGNNFSQTNAVLNASKNLLNSFK